MYVCLKWIYNDDDGVFTENLNVLKELDERYQEFVQCILQNSLEWSCNEKQDWLYQEWDFVQENPFKVFFDWGNDERKVIPRASYFLQISLVI